ncbi:hypothetical protein BsWGS_13408 [Bradybaena similaris]
MAQQRASVAPDSTSPTLRENVFGSGFGTNTQSTNLFAGQSNQTFRLFEASSGQSGTTVSLASSSPVTSSNIFGGNFAFASTAPVGQSGQPTFATNTNSQLFGNSGCQTATNPFLTNQSSMLFTASNEPSSLVQTGNTTSIPLSMGQFSFTPPVFSMNQRQQAGVNNASVDIPSSPPSFPTPASNIFGSFSGNNPFGSGNFTGSAASGPGVGSVLPSSSGIRKRDSSGAVSDNSLFGKPEKRSNQSEVYTGSTSVTNPVFALTQSHDVQPSPRTPLFSNTVSSTTHAATTFSSGSAFSGFQQRDTVLFNEKSSDSSRVENVDKGKVLFGKSQSETNVRASAPLKTMGLTFQSGPSCFTENNTSNNQKSSLQLSAVPTVSKSNESFSGFVTNALLFRDPKNSDSSLSQEDSSGGLFKRPVDKSSDQGQGTLFGKPTQSRAALFGKPLPSSSEPLDPDRASDSHDVSGRNVKSLSKWSRAKEVSHSDRKRKELDLPAETSRDKKSKVSDGEQLPSPISSRVRLTSRSSLDDQATRNSIVVRDIPAHLNRGPVLRKHFSSFGTIVRLQTMATKRAANITFETQEEALRAKNEGRHLTPEGPPVAIFLRSTSKTKSPSEKQTHPREYGKRSERPKTKPVPGSVEDELASMAELADFQTDDFSAVAKQSDVQKTTVARKKSPTPPPPPPVQDVDVAKGLLKSIYKAQAKDTSERVAILDSKDKLLRLLRGKQQADLATAKAFVGICPDMCPEKERYYREDTRRLAIYEVIPSTVSSLTGLKSKVDHARAVKEYSRSSADQEEPLPYELRPRHVLETTMNYLLSQVANLGEDGSWGEWYDFLWNRTRGIRKDITQQQLCDVPVAELLEKCSRFHIFCSERLCEEDMMTFDAKINSENLTKCLQTLKELYADLEKRGIFCPNEAEFRGYMVLMNLNEGDILREVQQLRPEIRDSPHISFAIQAYNALNANNYVRFFRLIEERATFLSACILHRYFNQMRSKALLIIMKAHGAIGKTVVKYPVEEMIRLLCFEDARQVESFCYHYCLSLKGVDVELDSKAYTEPEGSLPQTRSQSLIEIKQESLSIGEVVNGAPLPPLQLSPPYSSFDQDGVFILSSDIQEALDYIIFSESSKLFKLKVPASVEVTQQAPRMLTQYPSEVRQQVQRVKTQYSIEAVKSVARMVILEVIDTTMQEIAKEAVEGEMRKTVAIMSEAEDTINAVVNESLREISQQVFEEQELKLRKQLEEELAAQKLRVCNNLCEEIVDNTVAVVTKEMAEEEMRLVKAELHRHRLQRCSEQCTEDLLVDVLDEMVEDVAMEVYDVDVVMKLDRLNATENIVMVLRCRRFLQAWRKKYLAEIRAKRSLLDFPSAPSMKALAEQIQELVPHRPDTRITDKSFYIGERVKLCVESPMDVIQDQLHLNVHLSMASARHMLNNMVMWRPLDMTYIINAQLQRAFQSWKDRGLVEPDTVSLHWKLVVSLPHTEQFLSPEESLFSKWIRTKLCKGPEWETLLKSTPSFEGEVLSLYQINSREKQQAAGLCIRCFHGVWSDTQEISVRKKDLLKGTSAVMFILPHAESLLDWSRSLQLATWRKQKQRLHQILKQKPESPAVPLVLIIPTMLGSSNISVRELDENLDLSALGRQSHISAVHIAQPLIGDQEHLLQRFEDWTAQITNCLRFAASNIPVAPKLRVKPVSDYIEDAIVEFYKSTVYEDLRVRTKHQLLHQSPNILLSLYNNVVEHAAMVCTSGALGRMSWPAPDFDASAPAGHPTSAWNSEAHMCDLYELVSKMRLPYFRYSDMESDDWSVACKDVWTFVAAVTKKDSGFAKIALHHKVAELLSRCKKVFRQFCWLANRDGPCEPSYINMAWTDLIEACIHYKLVSLRTGHLNIRTQDDEDESTEDDLEPEEMQVFYQESDLDDWEPPVIWQDALRDTESAGVGLLKSTVENASITLDRTEADSMLTSAIHQGPSKTEADSMVTSAIHEGPSRTVLSTSTEIATDNSSSSLEKLKVLLEQEKAAAEKYEKGLEACLFDCSSFLDMESRNVSVVQGQLSPIMYGSRTKLND